MNFISQDN